MAHKPSRDRILPLRTGKKKKSVKTPHSEGALHHHTLSIREKSAQDHLLPVQFPYPHSGEESTRLVNIPWCDIGILYIRKIREHFPKGYFLDNANISCRIGRIHFKGLSEIPEDCEGLLSPPVHRPAFTFESTHYSQREEVY